MKKAFFNWSSGKDSAFALYKAMQSKEYLIESLLTTINKSLDRVTMHGLRRELLERQICQLDIPAQFIELPDNPSMEDYSRLMLDKISYFKDNGIEYSGFGDIFLEDLKKYRENELKKVGVNAFFPLWKQNTKDLMHEFLDLGFKTIVVCVNGEKLDKSFSGRIIDHSFIDDLPSDVDPCGENGEFHTFCFDGPLFRSAVPFSIGKTITRSYPVPGDDQVKVDYYFTDIL